MKGRPLVLMLAAGALVFLGVLLLYLPASWFAARLPPQVQCAQLGGSVWAGECLGLSVMNSRLGDATWNLSPWQAITGKLRGDVDLRGNGLAARSRFDLRFDGSGELTDLQANFPLDPAVFPAFPRGQRGQIGVELARVELASQAAPRSLQGSVELRDFRQLTPKALVLGSYQVLFDGTPVGKLRDLGGPFAVEGTVTFTPPSNYVVAGFITGRNADAERLVREITLGAQPDASGRSEFRIENSF